jgi:prepilin-type processing-associated H-X9-DG protein
MASPEPTTHHQRFGRAGMTRIELLVLLMCIAVLAAMLVLMRRNVDRSHFDTKDAMQVRNIHHGWLVYAREFDGLLPTPGLIDRLPFNGVDEPGRGEEDISQNTTANLFSACVMQNYFSPELCVGSTEPNPNVTVFTTYNYNLWNPLTGQYWDPAFVADLQTGSYVSFAHMPIFGTMKLKRWRDSYGGADWPILGNRGPLNGVHDPKSYTLQIHEPHDQWSGNICFADNHVEFLTGLPTAKAANGKTVSTQGLFRMDGGDDTDGTLTFTKQMKPEGPVIQHD